MQFRLGRFGAFGLAVLGVAGLPAVSHASFARAYSGKLSSNRSVSTQQVTADPASILQGSMSTEYDPQIVSLAELVPGPEFDISALIGIRLSTDPPTAERFVSDAAFFAGLPYAFEETGYLQVTFFRHEGSSAQSVIENREGFVTVDVDGPQGGDDTHAMFFTSISDDPNAIASYHLYREDGTKHDVLPDYLTQLDEQTFFDITDATVSGAVPEPTTGAIMLALAGAAALCRGRRSR